MAPSLLPPVLLKELSDVHAENEAARDTARVGAFGISKKNKLKVYGVSLVTESSMSNVCTVRVMYLVLDEKCEPGEEGDRTWPG